MPKYVAFLRAINVGGHTVKMDQLRSLFEELKFANVETFIASGNVIFESKTTNTQSLEKKIEKHLQQSLGYEVATFVRSLGELAAIAVHEAFNESELKTDGNTLFVAFVAGELNKQVKQRMASLVTVIDDFHLHGQEVYWLYRRANGESKFYGALLEKSLGMKVTVRNVNTVRKIVAKYS